MVCQKSAEQLFWLIRWRIWQNCFEKVWSKLASFDQSLLGSFACQSLQSNALKKCSLVAGSFPNWWFFQALLIGSRRSEMYHDVSHIRFHTVYLLQTTHLLKITQNTKSSASAKVVQPPGWEEKRTAATAACQWRPWTCSRGPSASKELGWFGPTYFAEKKASKIKHDPQLCKTHFMTNNFT